MLLVNLAQQAVEELCVIIVRCGAIRCDPVAVIRSTQTAQTQSHDADTDTDTTRPSDPVSKGPDD